MSRLTTSIAPLGLAILVASAGDGARAEEPGLDLSDRFAVSVYGAIGTDGGIEDVPGLDADFNSAYMVAVAPSLEFARWRDLAAFEVEGQVAQHFNKQDHTEFNALVVGRWLKFPWNETVRTSFAIGEGVSYATEIPEIERERSPNETDHILNYLMLELELAPPDEERWSFIARIHHRSGVFGLFDGVSRGSNFLGAGVKVRF